MRFAKIILIIYCVLIGGVALFDTWADPSRQPLKNIVVATAMSITVAGILKKKKELLLALPLYAIFSLGVTAANTKNIFNAVGQLLGLSLPLLLVFLNYKDISKSKDKGLEAKSSDTIG